MTGIHVLKAIFVHEHGCGQTRYMRNKLKKPLTVVNFTNEIHEKIQIPACSPHS